MDSTLLDEFERLKTSCTAYLKEVDQLLGSQLSDSPEELIEDLKTIEAKNGYIGRLLAQFNGILDKAKFVYMPGKDGNTELERKTELDYLVVEFRKWRDRVENISDSIDKRLSVGQSILKYYGQRPQ